MRVPSYPLRSGLTGAALLIATHLANAAEPSFAAVLSIQAANPVPEATLESRLLDRAKSMDLEIRIDRGEPDDGRITVLLSPTTEAEAREQVGRLVKQSTLELRKVHPDSDRLAELVREGVEEAPGYELRIHSDTTDEGEPIERPVLLTKEATVLSNHLQRVEVDPARAGVLDVELTNRGGDLMKALTGPMEKGRDRLAIVLDGKVISTPVVQDTLSSRFIISGLHHAKEREAIKTSLLYPLGARLELVSLRATAQPDR